jgi:hypothetical protein
MRMSGISRAMLIASVVVCPAIVSAQSSIVGTVRDTSGAVLPGVTIEASSPALIERVRSATTDSQGTFNIIDLRPGLYAVTFTLSGFKTSRQENLQLPAAFTATVNGVLEVGAIEETVTVTSEAAVVDVRSTGRTRVLSEQILDNVPTGGVAQAYALLVPGVTQSASTFSSAANTFRWSDLTFRGSRETTIAQEGFDTSHRLSGDGAQYMINQGMVQEIVVSGGDAGPEALMGGVVINIVPKAGGNRFSGSFYTHFVNEDFVSSNLSPGLLALGATTQSLRKSWDFNPSFGGPIQQNKLWFYASYRNLGNAVDTGILRDLDPLDWVYTADTSRPSDSEQNRTRNYSLRLTWQVNEKNTIAVHGDHDPNDWDNRGGTTGGNRNRMAPEATVSGAYTPQYLAGWTWKSPVSNRVFLEAGQAIVKNKQWFARNLHDAQTGQPVSPDPFAIGALDNGTNWLFRGSHFIGNFNNTWGLRTRVAASYIMGNHTFKVGTYNINGKDRALRHRIGGYIARVDSRLTNVNGQPGRPASIEIWGPEGYITGLQSNSIYAQDQWNMGRLTLSLGVRYDYVKTSADPLTLPANEMLPERSFEGVDKIIHYHDLSPRLGFAYDLFGTNRTALKVSVNRYVGEVRGQGDRHPASLAIPSTTRTWNDTNGNYIPDCNHSILTANGECETAANLSFGQLRTNPTLFDPKVDGGFGHRLYNWDFSTAIQHHLRQGLGIEVGYYRRWWGNQQVTDNLLVSPSDFSPFSVKTPSDARLPGGGGQILSGYYDLNPDKQGQVQSFVTHAKNFGDHVEFYNGFEFNVNARMPGGLQLMGGTITDRRVTENCYTIDSPQREHAFCRDARPYQTSMKLAGTWPAPYGVQVSGSIQAIPGPAYNGDFAFTRSDQTTPGASGQQVIGLGRQLTSSSTTLTIVEPNQDFGPHVKKVDMRLSKNFRVGTYRLTGSMDVLNLFNSAGILVVTGRVGPAWRNPEQVMGGRVYRLGGRVDF